MGNVVTQGSKKGFGWENPALVLAMQFKGDTEKDFFCFIKLLQRALLFRVCLKMREIQNLKRKRMPKGKTLPEAQRTHTAVYFVTIYL